VKVHSLSPGEVKPANLERSVNVNSSCLPPIGVKVTPPPPVVVPVLPPPQVKGVGMVQDDGVEVQAAGVDEEPSIRGRRRTRNYRFEDGGRGRAAGIQGCAGAVLVAGTQPLARAASHRSPVQVNGGAARCDPWLSSMASLQSPAQGMVGRRGVICGS
jgi:hypothetical protein